ncbi:MAG TPA: alpha/beta hydrolase [Bryobacteraceae bacterium]|jgi:acetyl esterase/lipase
MKATVALTSLFIAAVSFAQTTAPARATPPRSNAPRPNPNAEPETFPLWEHGAPGALGDADTDKPTLTIFRTTQHQNGTSVIIAPGGGYTNLSMNNEGRQEAGWFNAMGITAFVLKYRLGPRYHHPIELGDAQRAIRIVRSRAQEFDILPDRIGMMGFSAGGHLTATAGTKFDDGQPTAPDPIDRVGSRPDFLILAYPVISTDPAIAHAGSVRNLLGPNPTPEQLQDMSADLHVTENTPPTFLFSTNEDSAVPAENTIRFYLALRKAKVPAEMHIFENGPHGVGMALADPALSQWPNLLLTWLRGRGLLTKPPVAPAP